MNMKNRVAGICKDGSGNPTWKGLTIQWKSWAEFRAWSLANGFSRTNNSLDRERPSEGYGPNNCRWIPALENSRLSVYNMHAKNEARRQAAALAIPIGDAVKKGWRYGNQAGAR
jgi:hypothetical protein